MSRPCIIIIIPIVHNDIKMVANVVKNIEYDYVI